MGNTGQHIARNGLKDIRESIELPGGILYEAQTARDRYGPFNSTHEVYGVLKEEVDEFFDEVKSKSKYRKENQIAELRQIAAIAVRAIHEIKSDEIRYV